MRLIGFLFLSAILWTVARAETQDAGAKSASYLESMRRHFRTLQATGTDVYGPVATPMWMSVLDTRTGRPPGKPRTPGRVYRKIGAPGGTTLYWDQPLVVAAFHLSRITGCADFAESADRSIRSFLDHCVGEDGIFEWGNHRYYDAYEDTVVRFSGSHHELRPITPAWEVFWRHDREKCERYLRAMLAGHIYDPGTGAFNRHDDGKRGDAFLEAGGILAESAAWLYGKTKDPELLEMALKLARYSFSHRGETTGLVINQPDNQRWDAFVCTTEIGVWAQSLLRAAEHTGNAEFADMAEAAIRAWLKFGWDSGAGKFFGQLQVADGSPVIPEKKGYWPGAHADVWNPDQWPTHDYPMAVAEACVTLFERSHDEVFEQAIRRWAAVIAHATPAREGKGAYAEQYGRCIHFLARAGRVFGDEKWISQANALAEEAVGQLYEHGMFQGLPGTHLYESVDGVGYLFLALLRLETGERIDGMGFGF